ncbi:YcxB family protein [Paenibacillus sp. KN14-4R]|uniref:YcxB family protein n=1 Tax=Paenibacillus sp. KN14-4R TaxID=3445773 RepID=UPI003F9FF3D8
MEKFSNRRKYEVGRDNSIEEDDEYFYIFIDKIMAHIIPKRTFTTPAEMNLFSKQIKECLKNNK